ncbi:Chorismate mutase I / Prephenate dehydratase [hydrothermal vent metagenome]|uniref:Bifunctional chorismate mutase/prephenate dehydratase n=1 Tax=hydrothermal vent metagenome TaxID=652676 RepID=A0A3B1CQU9_9ZZZZ
MPDIKDLREKIDKIDDQLLKLINRRAALAVSIGKEKFKKSQAGHFHVPHRERDIIKRVTDANSGPFPDESIETVFREIFSATLALEKPLKIAYLGPETTFSHQAAIKQFGHSAVLSPFSSIEIIFSEVEQGNCAYGIVPVENSTEGVINLTLDCFVDSPLLICDELKLEVLLCLMSKAKDMKQVEVVYSHPQALAQSRNWLNRHLPGVEQVPVSSTANAAQQVKGEKKSAAIAGFLAAQVNGLNVLAQKIQDRSDNHTRFLVIGKEKAKKARHNKTAILFSIKDEAGSLLQSLQIFARNEINLTKIQSRPLRNRSWEYLFYLDFEGHVDDTNIARVIDSLRKKSMFLKVLGSFPEARSKI